MINKKTKKQKKFANFKVSKKIKKDSDDVLDTTFIQQPDKLNAPKVAVIWFPGTNCEDETVRVLRTVGIKADVVRWNCDTLKLRDYDGYVLAGGWSYEDRIRAGVIASRDPVMDVIKFESDKGKPVLGICNGAQILVEKGMVPSTKLDIEMALAPNHNPFIGGYYCTWTYVKVENTKGAFTQNFKANEIIALPVAHGEGRFTTTDLEVKEKIRKEGLIAFKYCDSNGKIIEKFPTNPNGSFANIAALYNPRGNVLAIMPHPERASSLKYIPGFFGTQKEGESAALARKIFESMRNYMVKMKKDFLLKEIALKKETQARIEAMAKASAKLLAKQAKLPGNNSKNNNLQHKHPIKGGK